MILTCELGFYVSGGQKCLKCANNCLKCTSFSFCSTCADGYFGSSCTSCHISCQTCIRSTACISCKAGYYSNGSILCTQCNFTNNTACVSCDSTGKCSRCLPNYYLDFFKTCILLSN